MIKSYCGDCRYLGEFYFDLLDYRQCKKYNKMIRYYEHIGQFGESKRINTCNNHIQFIDEMRRIDILDTESQIKELKQNKYLSVYEKFKLLHEYMVFQCHKSKKVMRKLEKMSYNDYLRTDYWSIIRDYILERDKLECQLCILEPDINTEGIKLHVHHKTYRYIAAEYEYPESLITLCSECHKSQHIAQDIIKKWAI